MSKTLFALKAQAVTLFMALGFKMSHAVIDEGMRYASDPKAYKNGITSFAKSHSLSQKAAGTLDLATKDIPTPVVASAGGPKPKKA